MKNFYENLKSKHKKEFNCSLHFLRLLRVLESMFKYDLGDDKIPPEFIERILITNGIIGFGLVGDELVACQGSLAGTPDKYYMGTEFNGVYSDGSISGKRGVDIAIGFNNTTYTPDFELLRYEHIFTECDISEDLNVIFSRLLNIPVIKDSKDKAAIEDCIKALLKGDITAFVSKNLFNTLVDGETVLDTISLSDVRDIDKLQYLVQYRDNVEKRFFVQYGHSLQTTGKIAQQTSDEVHGMDSVSLIDCLNRLEMRKRMCDEVNQIFNREWSVKFSPLWEKNYQHFLNLGEVESEVENDENEEDTGISDSDETT